MDIVYSGHSVVVTVTDTFRAGYIVRYREVFPSFSYWYYMKLWDGEWI